MKKDKIIYFGLLVIVLLVSALFFSYAFFTGNSEHHGKLNIVVGDLNYKIQSDDLVNNKVIVEAGKTKEITLNLTSLNKIDSKYELYYNLDNSNSGVSVGYVTNTIDAVSGSIDAGGSKEITIIVINDSDTNTMITFGVVGGFINNSLVLTQGNSLNRVIEIKNNFTQTILNNNTLIDTEPTLTTSSNNTTDVSGLYKSTATNDGSATYYFRGNVENNYVKYAGFIWRIVRINEDDTIRLIMQDGINNNVMHVFNSSRSDYTKMYYSNSNAKTQLESWYTTKIASNENYSNKIAIGDYYCEQAKVKYSSNWTSGSANMEGFNSSYIPNFECRTDGNKKGIVDSYIGLITYDEIVYAGAYPGTTNDSYYLNNGTLYWTMSPAGVDTNGDNIWFGANGGIHNGYSDYTNCLRPVINLKADTVVTGSGTSTDPYVVQD